MPIGCSSIVPVVMNEVWSTNKFLPNQPILDLGIGMGFYGACVRQWIDQGYDFKTKLFGIEGFEKYRNPTWDLYDEVIIGDIFYSVDDLAVADFGVILLLDVIEHFDKDRGYELIGKLRKLLHPSGKLVIATPGLFFEQGNVYGNEFERHRSLWNGEDWWRLNAHVMQDGSKPDGFGSYQWVVGLTSQ